MNQSLAGGNCITHPCPGGDQANCLGLKGKCHIYVPADLFGPEAEHWKCLEVKHELTIKPWQALPNSTTSHREKGLSYGPQVLDALAEIAFNPEFLHNRIEKERRAVLAEAQMMNTIEYRVDCQLLQYLHEENALGYRFPIGKTDQVSSS